MASTSSELVFIPAPGVGHIVSTVEIAKLLVNRHHTLSVTILIMKLTIETGVMSYVETLNQTSIDRIRFVDLPRDESLPEPKSRMLILHNFIESQAKYVRQVVADMAVARPGFGQLAGFVIDMFCTPMIDVANEFGVPTYLYFTSSAAFLGFRHYLVCQSDDHNVDVHKLVTDADSEQLQLDIPCFANPVPVKVLPPALHDEVGASFTVSSARRLREVKGVLVNTSLEMETHAIGACLADKTIPPVYPVGPILDLNTAEEARRPTYDGIMRWLDLQPPSSVVFLCFGSMGSFGEAQVREIAHALESSGHRFLWSLRRPPRDGMGIFPVEYEDPGEVLPDGFLERTAGVGKVIGWAPQASVLAHRAVGGFVSHCGWNSILESVWFGVPIAAWPMFAEQQLNAFEMVVELGLGVEIKLDYKKNFFAASGEDTVIVTKDEIERGIRKLMDGENEIRNKVKEMSEKSRAAVAEGGSSYDSLGHFIDIIIEDKEIPN